MLDRIDRVLIAVNDPLAAAQTWARLFDAAPLRTVPSPHLGATRHVLALGESEIEFCAPDGPGPVRDHLDRWGEGLFAGGIAAFDLGATRANLDRCGVRATAEGDSLFLDPADTYGMPLVLTQAWPRHAVGGPIDHLFEITNTITSDWRRAAAHFARIFGLDAQRFCPIHSDRFGYDGTLTLFDPPNRLDRIEISQVTDPNTAMGRWVDRRGDSLNMCYVETNDLATVIERLDAAGARWTPRGGAPAAERNGLWIHPSATHGVLLGVSRRTLAWGWSGRADKIAPLAVPPKDQGPARPTQT